MNEIEYPVGLELHWMAAEILLVQATKLRLALVILTNVALLQCYPGMDFVDVGCELVLDMLHSQILT